MNAPSIEHVEALSTATAGVRTIGAILVDSGRITVEQAEQIMKVQRAENIRFGEAARKLKMVSEEDLQFALAGQYGYAYLRKGEGKLAPELIAAYQPHDRRVEELRALRSQLMLRWFSGDAGHRALAIVGPGRKEGRSHLAANLAVVFAQLGERTLLIDADMRHGRMHELFKVDNHVGLSGLLAERTVENPVQRVDGFAELGVIPAGPTPPNPAELLGREGFARLLLRMGEKFEVILVDTPDGSAYSDAQTVCARTVGALLVARRQRTRLSEVTRLAASLQDGGTTMVGSVLKRF